jgi:hypothetical protein
VTPLSDGLTSTVSKSWWSCAWSCAATAVESHALCSTCSRWSDWTTLSSTRGPAVVAHPDAWRPQGCPGQSFLGTEAGPKGPSWSSLWNGQKTSRLATVTLGGQPHLVRENVAE